MIIKNIWFNIWGFIASLPKVNSKEVSPMRVQKVFLDVHKMIGRSFTKKPLDPSNMVLII